MPYNNRIDLGYIQPKIISPLRFWRCYRKLCFVYKVLKSKHPEYLFDLIHARRAPCTTINNIPILIVKHSFFKKKNSHLLFANGRNKILAFVILREAFSNSWDQLPILCITPGPILDIGGMGACCRSTFFQKRAFCQLASLKRCYFSPFLMKTLFLKGR